MPSPPSWFGGSGSAVPVDRAFTHPIFMSIQERFPDKSLIGSDGIVGTSGINLRETRCWP